MTVPLRNPHAACYLLKREAFPLSLNQVNKFKIPGRVGCTKLLAEIQNKKRANALFYFVSLWEENQSAPKPNSEFRWGGTRVTMGSPLIKRNKGDLGIIFLMQAFPLTRVKGLEKISCCGGVCLCCHYLDRGQAQAQAQGSIPRPHLQQRLVGK